MISPGKGIGMEIIHKCDKVVNYKGTKVVVY